MRSPEPTREDVRAGVLPLELRAHLRNLAVRDEVVRGRAIRHARPLRPADGLRAEAPLASDRVFVCGREEIDLLGDRAAGPERVRRLCAARPPLIVLADAVAVPPGLDRAASEAGIVLVTTDTPASRALLVLERFLVRALAPRVRIHGVLMDLHGLGVVLLGESGIGKSECALELISRGHRLVADDAVDIRLIEGELVGEAPELSRYHIEVRGLGIVNARELFGAAAVRDSKRVDLAVELVPLAAAPEGGRLSRGTRRWEVLGVEIPLARLPVAPGRNVAVLLEVAARQELLRQRGRDTGSRLADELEARLRRDGDR
ncbi:MAG: HPr(Ser) kinase/phosphatase [Acidobacteria bacterium]|nr:MAG: HPr(Ser) kinase/phosphatase [Acidobacteriota bacterium]